jgi:hypothetical protein
VSGIDFERVRAIRRRRGGLSVFLCGSDAWAGRWARSFELVSNRCADGDDVDTLKPYLEEYGVAVVQFVVLAAVPFVLGFWLGYRRGKKAK